MEVENQPKIKNQTERPGYKKTKLGWIPKCWSIKTLGAIGTFTKGKGINKSVIKEVGLPCIRYAEIYTKYDNYTETFTSFIDESQAANSKSIQTGDLLFAGSGETLEDIGKCIAYLGKTPAFAGGDIIILRPKSEYSQFLGLLLNHYTTNRQTHKLGQGHSVVHIYSSGLKNLKVPLPPLPEQLKIAKILSTWDTAIATLEQLIAAKEIFKQGLMQVLLTGKKRFEGFEGEWREVRLGKVADIDKNNLKSKTESNYSFKYISLSDVESGIINSNLPTYKFLNAPSRARRIIKVNSVIIATVRPNLQAFAILKDHTDDLIVSTGFAVIDCKESLIPNFLIQYLFSKHITNQIEALIVGTNYPAINSADVKNLKIKLPSLQEQKKIASVLIAADKEIKLLKHRLAQLEDQKRGLMQRLLTGAVRVKI